MVDQLELDLLRAAAADKHQHVRIVCTAAAYSCCGRGWQRRDGYEQTYQGWVDNLLEPEGMMVGTFMLYSPGLGKLTYVVAVRFDELELVETV